MAVRTLPFAGFGSADQQAAAILAERQDDGATTAVPYTPGTAPGEWQPTPNPIPADPPAPADRLPAILPGWGRVTPFVLLSSRQFLPDEPPALTSERYTQDYQELQALGAKVSEVRTADREEIARFWFGSSPVSWSQMARTVAADQGLDAWQQARVLALVNLAMADGVIAGFDTKYRFTRWRPITAIQAGETDDNEETVGDPSWESLLNTPAHPDYVSTHAVQGGRRPSCCARSSAPIRWTFSPPAERRLPGSRARTVVSQRRRRKTPTRGCTPACTSGAARPRG
jgi:hypothetical protein